MMIKDIKVAQCDVCGRIDPAVRNYDQRDGEWYEMPKGWHKTPVNSGMILCPVCWNKLKGGIRDEEQQLRQL